ncbi:hypothetical protein N7G274_003117 [Stereocaulon virgatum]|uniref:SURP motif domain-containing protein n=1 Tax=Stereocaulon virgatum TaxID=373712 RepID=A0ABR4AF04_9LECA
MVQKKSDKVAERKLNQTARTAYGKQQEQHDAPNRGGSYNNAKAQTKSTRRPAQLRKRSQDANTFLKQYRLFINEPRKRTLLMQYPNREVGQEYRAANGQKPFELRMKPKTGVVEIDVPMEIHVNYDKEKGIEYGDAMRDSRVLQQGGCYGLSGGLGVGYKLSAKEGRRALLAEGPSKQKLLENFEDANNKGYVMNKITLGGRIVPFQDGDPIYMYATFKGDICTFTRIDAMVQLRPQFDHVDALRDREKSNHRAERAVEDAAVDEPEEIEARAVNMAVKSAENLEEMDLYGGMSATNKLLKDIRDEPWQRLQWIDQDEPESFQVYDDNFVYQDPDNAVQLVSEMTNEQYLDAISCPRIDPIKQGAKILGGDDISLATETEGTDVEKSELDLGETTEEEDYATHSADEGPPANDDDDQWEYWPDGAVRPDSIDTQIKIEGVCRRLVAAGNTDAAIARNEAAFKQAWSNNPARRAQASWLWEDDPHHVYYKWRLSRNRAGKGIPESEDEKHYVRK